MDNGFSYYDWNRTDNKNIYIDSVENPLDSLESILQFLDREDNLKWKWIILALHHSLYHFGIANLEGGNFENVLTKVNDPDKDCYHKRGDENWKKSEIVLSENPPLYRITWNFIDKKPELKKRTFKGKKRLLGFWSVIARIQDAECYMQVAPKPIIFTDSEEKSIVKLVDLRNRFMHYEPMMWQIEIEYCKQILFDIINIIEKLALETYKVIYVDEKDRERTKEAILKIKLLKGKI